MTLAVVFVILSALALVALVFLTKGHWFGRAGIPQPSQLQPIDVEAFRNLIDEDESEEEYLRATLHSREFRRIHLERVIAAVEYVRGAYRNAGILVQIAQAAKESPDPAVASAAGKLFEGAIQLRLYAFQVIPLLCVSALFAGRSGAPRRLFERYDTLTRQAQVLSCTGSTGHRA